MRKLLALLLLSFSFFAAVPAHAGFWSDHTLSVKVSTKLQFNKKLLQTKIKVEAHDGVVILSGNVPEKALIAEAVRTAKNVEGVRKVENHLKVGPTMTDEPTN